MSVKKNICNICLSFLFAILFDVIYSIFGLLVIANINIRTISAVIVITLLCGLFCAGYMIGAKLLSITKIRVVSVVIVPMVLLSLLFGFGIIAAPVVSMLMQYPGIILIESLAFESQSADSPILLYFMVILYHLLSCLSLLFGSYHRSIYKKQ